MWRRSSFGALAVALLLTSAGLAQNQLIFSDGFESGDVSSWSRVRKPHNIEVIGDAASSGSFGAAFLAGGGRTSLDDKTPRRENDILVEFFFNPNNVELRRNKRVDIFQMFGKGGKGAHTRLLLEQVSDNSFDVTLLTRENNGRFRTVASAEVQRNAWTRIEILWARAGAGGLEQGLASLFTNGAMRGEKTALDNDRVSVEATKFGYLKKAGAARSGGIWMDDFASFRTLAP